MTKNNPTTDVFNLMPGLVINHDGAPSVVTSVNRDDNTELITFMIDTPHGNVALTRDWGRGDTIDIIGLAVDANPDNIDLFKN